jgi:hypothetical protein
LRIKGWGATVCCKKMHKEKEEMKEGEWSVDHRVIN